MARSFQLPRPFATLTVAENLRVPMLYTVNARPGSALSPAERETMDRAFALIVGANLAQPRVYVHRDYMPRNLMVCEDGPGILDFQDAVRGPITYDIACLLRDAFISWEEEQELDWAVRYWQRARQAGLPVEK